MSRVATPYEHENRHDLYQRAYLLAMQWGRSGEVCDEYAREIAAAVVMTQGLCIEDVVHALRLLLASEEFPRGVAGDMVSAAREYAIHRALYKNEPFHAD
jgi:hypothetical protein